MLSSALTETLLVADVGASNARFSIATPEGKFIHTQVLPCSEFPEFLAVLTDYLKRLKVSQPANACISLAAPVLGDLIEFTNNPWSFSVAEIKRKVGFRNLLIINDFAALAHAIPFLSKEKLRAIGGGAIAPAGNKIVLGPGTGLGVAGLLYDEGRWLPMVGEGGYVDLAPKTEYEQEIWRLMLSRFGRVSAERILSGSGLLELYKTIIELAERQGGVGFVKAEYDRSIATPEMIVHRALEGSCRICLETVAQFCAFLGDVAGNLALTFGARGGVYLGGGILPRILPLLEGSLFRERFEAKGRMNIYMKDIPVFLIQEEMPALRGCVSAFFASKVGKEL